MNTEQLSSSSGVVSHESDLWCTYAAVRTLRWLDRLALLDTKDSVIRFLATRQNSDGGYAWSAGMNSDAWATYYCTQALSDVGAPASDRPSDDWVHSTRCADGGFGMMPGQSSDVWATYYSVRTLVECYGTRPPAGLWDWLAGLQTEDGGLAWSPAHAKFRKADVRACYYGITAWSTVGFDTLPWDRDRLVSWLRARQSDEGGFRFAEGDDTDCLWATFRATNALRRLGATPADRDACVTWVRGRLADGGSFTRWPGYPVQDVWAAFCAVGALRALGDDVRDIADRVATVVLTFRNAGGGFTYRTPRLASDVLTTAAHGLANDDVAVRGWLESCVLPNEDGVMYMPGRGSEVRCTLWALAAGAFADDPVMRARIGRWLVDAIQNPDGGFGYWEGRASDMVSTAAAAELLRLAGVSDPSVWAGVATFVASCRAEPDGYANVPGGRPTLRSTLQAARALYRAAPGTISTELAGTVSLALARHRVRGGGFANEGNRLPDLLSTYEATLTADLLGLPVDIEHTTRFTNRVRVDGGYAWTPLMPIGGGSLADCAGELLSDRLTWARSTLPPLTIS